MYLEKHEKLKERFMRIKGMTHVGGSFIYDRHLLSSPISDKSGEINNGRSQSVCITESQRNK